MKKIITTFIVCFATIVALSAAAKAVELPSFTGENSENAVVVGTKGLYGWSLPANKGDFFYLDVVNKTNEYNIPLKIYMMKKDGGKWEELGNLTLDTPCQVKQFDTDHFGKDEKAYAYFAIGPQNGKAYNITVSDDWVTHVAYAKKYLVFTVAPVNPDEDMSYKDKATIIKLADLYTQNPDETFKDNIKVINNTSSSTVGVKIYGFSEEYDPLIKPLKKISEQIYGAGDGGADKVKESQRIWIYGLNVKSEAWNAVSFVEAKQGSNDAEFHSQGLFHFWSGPFLYKNFAVVFEDGKSYKVNAHIEHDDLYIELTD